jgi:sialic acid synthase SpsE
MTINVPAELRKSARTCVVERHITLDRSMWGSDQAASLVPSGIIKMVSEIRLVEASMGDGVKKIKAVALDNDVFEGSFLGDYFRAF